MAHRSRILIICATLTLATACNSQPANQPANTPAPAGPAAAVASNTYKGVGVVKAIDTRASAIMIDHQNIEGLMPAMEMEFAVTDASLLNGIAVNDQIDFTIETSKGEMKVTAIKKR